MLCDNHRYALELQRTDETALGQFPVTVDWEPAREWARLAALREGKDSVAQASSVVTVEPQWHSTRGEPYVAGFRVTLSANGSGEIVTEVPIHYLKRLAQQTAQSLVEKKILTDGEQFLYSVLAFPGRKESPQSSRFSFTVEEVPTPLNLQSAQLADFHKRAVAFGQQDAEDIPVFIPQSVLDEGSEMTRKAEANEIGGILIGHLCRDTEAGSALFLQVTSLIPARHTLSESTKLTFTAETWSAVDAAIQLRRGGEQMIGWFHSHPAKYWCSPKCSLEARRKCPLGRSFFSSEDCNLHRTVFPMAHCVALVITHTDDGLRYALFGWQQGILAQRGFHILNSTREIPGQAVDAVATIGGNEHEKICT